MNRYLILSFSERKRKKNSCLGDLISSLEHAASRQTCSNNKRAIRFQPFRLALPLAWVGWYDDLGFLWHWAAKLASLRVRESTSDGWIEGMHFPGTPMEKVRALRATGQLSMRFHRRFGVDDWCRQVTACLGRVGANARYPSRAVARIIFHSSFCVLGLK